MYIFNISKVMSSFDEEAQKPNAAGWVEKYWINLEGDIFPANGTRKVVP